MDHDGASHTPKDTPTTSTQKDSTSSAGLGIKRTASDGSGDSKRVRSQTSVADPHWSLEKQHADAIINFLIR